MVFGASGQLYSTPGRAGIAVGLWVTVLGLGFSELTISSEDSSNSPKNLEFLAGSAMLRELI